LYIIIACSCAVAVVAVVAAVFGSQKRSGGKLSEFPTKNKNKQDLNLKKLSITKGGDSLSGNRKKAQKANKRSSVAVS
jgi:hypothetical protein